MKVYHKFAKCLYSVLRWATAAVVVGMLVLMLVEVVRRYLFDQTFPWSDEIIRYLLLYCTFLGGAAAYYQKGLVAFTLVFDKLSRVKKAFLMVVNNTICLVFFAFLTRYAIAKVTSSSVVKSVSTASHLSMAVPYMAIPIGLVLMIIFTIDFYPDLIRDFKAALRESGEERGQAGKGGRDA